MLFSLYDYYQYRTMKGRYSVSNLLNNGLEICSYENITKCMKVCQSNYLCLIYIHSRVSWMSWLVMYYTTSFISHCAMCCDQKLYDTTIDHGVIQTSLTNYIDNKSYIQIIKLPIDNSQYQAVIKEAERLKGTRYGWSSVFKIFLIIISGKSKDWRLKFSADFYILLLLVSMINLLPTFAVIAIAFIYGIILIWNRIVFNHKNLSKETSVK